MKGAAALAGAALLALALPAQAVTCGAATTGLAFGAYDLLSPAPRSATANVRVTCSLSPGDGPAQRVVGALVLLSPGLSGSYGQRQMASGGERMNYNVFTTNAYATVWGNGAGGTGVQGFAFTLNPAQPTRFRDLTGYGRVPALQDLGAGSYTDTLVVTVFF